MNTRINRLFVALLVVLFVAGCTGQAATVATAPSSTAVPPTPQPSATEVPALTNAEIVQEMVDRLNAGDAEGSLDYFAEDAIVYLAGMPPTGMEYYNGKDQLRPLWEDCVVNHFLWETEVTDENGDLVTVRALTWHDFTRELGTAPNEFIDFYKIKDGKITEYYSVITEAALAKFKPALLAVMPMEPAPMSNDAPVSAMAVTFSEGTCAYQGPFVLQIGEVEIIVDVQDKSKANYALTVFTLAEDHDMVDLMASTMAAAPPAWAEMIFMEEIDPGKTETYTLTIEEGPVYMVCWSQPPDLAIGNIGPFEVK